MFPSPLTKVAPLLAGAGLTLGLLAAPVAAAQRDPCESAVTSTRCLGPSGIHDAPELRPGPAVPFGPSGRWGSAPPIG